MTTCADYLSECAAAVRGNQALRQNPDWRWICRGIGHGLSAWSEKEVKAEIGSLYGNMVVRTEFGTRRGVTVSAKQVVGWIMEARQEVMDKNEQAVRVRREVISRAQSMVGISIGEGSGTVRLLAWATKVDPDTVRLVLINMAGAGELVEAGLYAGKQTYSLRKDLRP